MQFLSIVDVLFHNVRVRLALDTKFELLVVMKVEETTSYLIVLIIG